MLVKVAVEDLVCGSAESFFFVLHGAFVTFLFKSYFIGYFVV